jgi:RimJ/RimL family protein N-acetyltransferase
MSTPITTARLVLREFTLDDVQAFYVLNSDPEVLRYTGDGGVRDLAEARKVLLERPIADYRKHGYGRWACVEQATGELIGFAGLKFLDELQDVDLGYRFRPAWWGRGLATEASRAVIEYGFRTLALPHILGLVKPEHTRSVRVLTKLGFRDDGLMEYFGQQVSRYVIDRESFARHTVIASILTSLLSPAKSWTC